MILGVYATLGIFLLFASRNPSANSSLIAFTTWSSLVHAAIMAVQAFRNTSEHGHLLGDIPALFIVGVVLIALSPPKQSAN
jgi:glucose uptake protein GlcU